MMTLLIILTAGAAPGIFWMWYVYKRDRFEPEPVSLVLRAFFYGALATIPAIIPEIIFQVNPLSSMVIIAPVVEETVKFSVVFFFFRKRCEVNEPVDLLVYGAAVALGFATVENCGYLFNALAQGNLAQVALLRAILSVPGHFLFSSIWAYGLARHKFQTGSWKAPLWIFLVSAIVAHALFNAIALFNILGGLFFIILMTLLWMRFYRSAGILISLSPFKKEKNGK
ncbi:MAG TPA: PrsW family intramembrane metalloprotease [Firmicutes bacterium]|nr:PrsW family intramembrane metalloprotease [Bacillota bacterium]